MPVSQRIRSPRKSDPGRIRYASGFDPTSADSIRGINGAVRFLLCTSHLRVFLDSGTELTSNLTNIYVKIKLQHNKYIVTVLHGYYDCIEQLQFPCSCLGLGGGLSSPTWYKSHTTLVDPHKREVTLVMRSCPGQCYGNGFPSSESNCVCIHSWAM